ncbi:peptidase inhibitor family I36 protein [Amycolatopsis suaedae]|uniref:Peptidase inhibitor family I36 protein n=1 Tax=Amycolatopsis suaedae TaxID=2510978 RepID=A0A4Q7IXG5_9PSEU|nr:peptidase inhibitor family I36 protein [Amycolatopsis suaedae]RZQ59630.1 hypothetical protein EWH70_32890 [Amycolatopsis suaedae]
MIRYLSLRKNLPRILVLSALGLLTAAGVAHASSSGSAVCDRGQFCVWSGEFYVDQAHRLDLRTANPEECLPLPEGFDGHSFVNRMDRHVTVYEDRECATEGDFTTYPGGGTYVPQAPFVVRAIQIWN